MKLKTTSSIVVAGLHHSCQCHVTEDYIQSIVMLPCVTEGSVIVKITLTLIKGYTGEEMLMFLKEWSDTVPTIKLDGLVLSIESVCNSSDCLSVTSSSTVQLATTPSMIDIDVKESASSTLISTISVPLVVVIVLIIIGIIIVISVTLKRKTSRCVCLLFISESYFKCIISHAGNIIAPLNKLKVILKTTLVMKQDQCFCVMIQQYTINLT